MATISTTNQTTRTPENLPSFTDELSKDIGDVIMECLSDTESLITTPKEDKTTTSKEKKKRPKKQPSQPGWGHVLRQFPLQHH